MWRMANRKYLDPAYSLILKFAPEGRLKSGIDRVAAITGRDPTRVFRWMLPKSRGGTGGEIPHEPRKKLYAYAQRKRLPVEPGDFFEARAA